MNKIILGALALLGGCVFAAEPPFGTVTLNGGRVEPVELALVANSNEHLNFCFATRFPDDSVYLNHSAGIHTVTEYGCRDISSDNGKTWQKNEADFGGFNAYLTRDGKKAQIGCWNDKPAARHEITRTLLSDDGKSVQKEKSVIELPFETTFRLHREVLRTRDGRLLLPGYGRKAGQKKLFAFVIESLDDGKTWRYLSTLMEDPEGKTPEGPNEGAVIELANGDLLAVVRVGGGSPLQQLRSTDGGRSWSAPVEVAPFSVAPAMRILENGALVIVTGRPRLYLLIDFTGTGNNYQRYLVYGGSGSSYASILETAPNELTVIYDESDFGSWRNLNAFSRIFAAKYRVVKDENAKAAGSDSAIPGYPLGYSAASKGLPEQDRLFLPAGYKPKNAAGTESFYELRTIAERPHPVLYLEHRGVTEQQRFPHFSTSLPAGTTALDAAVELRIEDAAEKRPQFSMRFCFENPKFGEKNLYGWVAFGAKEIMYRTAGKLETVPFDAIGKFHAYQLRANAATGGYSLFVDGAEKPLFEARLTADSAIGPGFTWGDGASNVFGAVSLSYIGLKPQQ